MEREEEGERTDSKRRKTSSPLEAEEEEAKAFFLPSFPSQAKLKLAPSSLCRIDTSPFLPSPSLPLLHSPSSSSWKIRSIGFVSSVPYLHFLAYSSSALQMGLRRRPPVSSRARSPCRVHLNLELRIIFPLHRINKCCNLDWKCARSEMIAPVTSCSYSCLSHADGL